MADVLVSALWADSDGWPQLSLAELRERASEELNYQVSASTVRATIYAYPKIFNRVEGVRPINYEVSREMRK